MCPCQVAADLANYLAKVDYEDRMADDLDRRIADLMADGGEYNPLDPDNLSLAIENADLDDFWPKLAKAASEGNGAAVLDMMKIESFDYWYKHAKTQAEAEQERDLDDIRMGVPGDY